MGWNAGQSKILSEISLGIRNEYDNGPFYEADAVKLIEERAATFCLGTGFAIESY